MSEMPTAAPNASNQPPHFSRTVGLIPAIAINMTQICGIGPFITIPLIVGAMGGPQAIIGWILGAILAICDGLVWAELGAAMPGAGGTYIYLREAFQYRTGRLMPFLFVWTAMIFIPLTMATGVIGLMDYLGYYFPNMPWWLYHGVSLAIVGVVIFALYRNITTIARITMVLWIIMFLAMGTLIAACFTHFHPQLAFSYPPGAFKFGSAFFLGLGQGLIYSAYDYMGYNTTAYMAEEMRNPGRILPRSIIYSILGMMVLYLVMNVGVLGVLPWKQVAASDHIGSIILEQTWGKPAALIFTGLIIITALASVYTGLLGGSRVPFNAARDKVFLPIFGRLHPRLNFPHLALVTMGIVTAIGTFFPLDTVINALTAVMIIVQSLGQIVALVVLRRRRPDLKRPYKMFWYPLPGIIAIVGWIYLYYSSGTQPILLSLIWLALGVGAFLIWAILEKQWPFGPKEIREDY
ncbi:MAG TPA: APC family permease [Phycisphaerae bacterium]|nr:APC family permease [Phycisphaerae bacterium]